LIKIIHVDDEKNYLDLTKEILAVYDKEINIESFTSPRKVIENVLTNEPDLVLSDYSMPEMNGIELIRQLRKYSNVPVILYSGSEKENIAEKAFEAGVEDYIRKSFDTMHYLLLLKRIKNAVDSYRARRTLETAVMAQV